MKNFNNLYKDYLIKYEKAVEKATEKGEPIFDTKGKYSKIEFKTMYEALQNDMRAEGRTVTSEKTTKALIEKQMYSKTLKQAQVLKKAMSERGFEVTVHEARVWGGLEDNSNAPQGFREFWNAVRLRENELKLLGHSKKKIAEFIAIEFFGS